MDLCFVCTALFSPEAYLPISLKFNFLEFAPAVTFKVPMPSMSNEMDNYIPPFFKYAHSQAYMSGDLVV